METRDQKTKELFIKLLKENPEWRFWQTVRNFSPYNFICGGNTLDKTDARDTFYIEADEYLSKNSNPLKE